MKSALIKPVILCGGSGTRLWPLSRKDFPKQFVPLIDNKSLLQLTFERMRAVSVNMLTVGAEEHRFLLQDAAESATVRASHILEPVGRNTAPAMAAAAILSNQDDLLLFAPADHYLPDTKGFADTIWQGISAALAGHIVAFGVSPSFPSTAYGYIGKGEILPDGHACKVIRFTEKPDPVAARDLMQSGHLWNTGILLVKAAVLLKALAKHAPDILESCRKACSNITADGSFIHLDGHEFSACRSESIDYAVLEKHDSVAVLPYSSAWSDVGSWNAMATLVFPDDEGNRLHGQAHALQASGTFIHAPHRPVVAVGTKNLFIVDSPDALLVADENHMEKIKDVVTYLHGLGLPQAIANRLSTRPWGAYETTDSGEGFRVKRITVKPGGKLSLQTHRQRAEHWIVVRGTAKVTRGIETFMVSENQSTFIPLGVRHRLENPGDTTLELIEVQSGSYLGEDDIVRFEDIYDRADAPLHKES